MNDREYKKLRRMFAVTWFLLLVFIVLSLISFVAYGKSTNAIAGPQGIPGQQGKIGETGLSGPMGFTGQQGPAGSTTFIPTPTGTPPPSPSPNPSPIVIQGEKGDKGDTGAVGKQGEPGAPGREVEFQIDPLTKDLEWRYVGDDLWTVLIDGCNFQNTCKGGN